MKNEETISLIDNYFVFSSHTIQTSYFLENCGAGTVGTQEAGRAYTIGTLRKTQEIYLGLKKSGSGLGAEDFGLGAEELVLFHPSSFIPWITLSLRIFSP